MQEAHYLNQVSLLFSASAAGRLGWVMFPELLYWKYFNKLGRVGTGSPRLDRVLPRPVCLPE